MRYALKNIAALLLGCFILISTIGINMAIYSCNGCHHEIHEIASVTLEDEACSCDHTCNCCETEHQHIPQENSTKHFYSKLDVQALTEQQNITLAVIPVILFTFTEIVFNTENNTTNFNNIKVDPPPGGRTLLALISVFCI